MMADVVEHELFQPLQAAVASGDLPKVVKAADKILRALPGDKDALQAKLVALIKQGSFEGALSFMEQDKSDFFKTRTFERCYCLFRLHRLEEALAQLESATTPAELELRAQVLYRLERYDEAMPAYRGLMDADGADGEADMEHATNLVAAMVGHEVATLAEGGRASADEPPVGDGYEHLYNTSCLMMARGRHPDALTAIDAAIADCREVVMAEPGVTEEEVEAELLLLRVQRGAVLHSLGDTVEASKELHQALKHNTDPMLGAIAAANLLAVNKNHNVFDSRKKLPLVGAPEARAKMTAAQRLLVSKNHVLLLMFMGHTEPLKKQLEAFVAEFPESDLPCLVKASNLMRRKSAALSRECLQTYIDENPGRCDEVRLVMAQMRIEDEDHDAAVKQLQEIKSIQHSPGFTGVLVELLSLQERQEDATATLNAAIASWEQDKSPEAHLNLITLLRAGAAYNTMHSKFAEAAELYKKILDLDRRNVIALTELIKCYAEYDLETAEKYAEQLPPVGTEGPALDVDFLERANARRVARPAAGPAAGGKAGAASAAADEPQSELAAIAAAAAAERPKRKRKKRPAKLPKDYNPNIPPDPERWLPRYERSEYKKRHKKKNALHHALQRGPQGASKAAADEAAERAAALEAEKAAKAAKAEAAAAAQLAQRKKKNKKKK